MYRAELASIQITSGKNENQQVNEGIDRPKNPNARMEGIITTPMLPPHTIQQRYI